MGLLFGNDKARQKPNLESSVCDFYHEGGEVQLFWPYGVKGSRERGVNMRESWKIIFTREFIVAEVVEIIFASLIFRIDSRIVSCRAIDFLVVYIIIKPVDIEESLYFFIIFFINFLGGQRICRKLI